MLQFLFIHFSSFKLDTYSVKIRVIFGLRLKDGR